MARRGPGALRAARRWAIAAALAALCACGEDEITGDKDSGAGATDSGGSDGGGVSPVDGGGVKDTGTPPADGGAGDDVPAIPDVQLPDSTRNPNTTGLFEQMKVPGDVNTAWHACWSEGSTRAYIGGTGGNIVGWNGNAWSILSQGAFQTLHGVAATPSGLYAHAVGIAGTLAQGKQPPKGLAGQWGAPGGCKAMADCNDNDNCTSDYCDAGTCRHTPSGAPGCCGSKPLQEPFVSVAGWLVKDLYEGSADKGGVMWSAAAMTGAKGELIATSPPKALYFGRTDVPCVSDATKVCPTFGNGKVVGASALSAPIALPPATKTEKVSLTFQLRMQAENGIGFDALTVKVVEGNKKTEIWNKDKIGGSGDTEGLFALQQVDLAAFAGKSFQLEIAFDSKDASLNDGEGVFIDDVIVSTTCKSGDIALNGMSQATFFDVWAADDEHAWAVGTDASIARWDGKAWTMQTGTTPPRDTLALGGVAGGLVLGVGQKGKAFTLTPQGPGLLTVATALDLVDVDVDPSPPAGSPLAIAVTNSSLVYEYDGTTWKLVSVPAFGIKGVAALGNGVWALVAGGMIMERSVTGTWGMKAGTIAALNSVTGLGGGGAMAVGTGGTVVTRTGGQWVEANGALGLSHAKAISSADGVAFAAGENGLVARFQGGAWTQLKSGTGKHLNAVWAHSADLAWAVGLGGTVLRWNGTTFELVATPYPLADFLAVWGSDPNDVYLAAKGGVLLRWNGVSFQVLEAPVFGTLRDVHGFSAEDVWAVGSKGGVFHLVGGSWTQVPIEPYQVGDQPEYKVTSDLYAIWGSAPNNIWAAGAPDSHGEGVLVHYDGKAWRYLPAFKDEVRTVRAIWGWAADRILFAGTQGMVLAFDGKSFTALESGSIATFHDICGWGKDALLVGGIGTVLRYLPPLPTATADADAGGDAAP